MNKTYIIYSPLVLAVFILVFGINIYCIHRYGDLRNNSIYDKYKLSPNNILIRLKLFKYNNNFNLILLIPYLITIGLFVVILILYVIYWCGATRLELFLGNRWLSVILLVVAIFFMAYSAIIDSMIGNSGGWDSPDFTMNSKNLNDKEKNKKDKKD